MVSPGCSAECDSDPGQCLVTARSLARRQGRLLTFLLWRLVVHSLAWMDKGDSQFGGKRIAGSAKKSREHFLGYYVRDDGFRDRQQTHQVIDYS